MSDRLFRRGRIWYGWAYEAGKQVKKSTGCTDKQAARVKLAELERRAADPEGHAKAEATLKDAFALLNDATLAKVRAKTPTRSEDTVAFQCKQSKGWLLYAGMLRARSVCDPSTLTAGRRNQLRDEGEKFPLEKFNGGFVDGFIAWRRKHGEVIEGTIGKDLSVMRPAMRYALRAGMWDGSLEKTFPKHELHYTPTDRWSDAEELERIRDKLLAERFAVLAYAYALGAETRACRRALKTDLVDPRASFVHVRGTKKKTRDRYVPVRFQWQRDLLDFVREHARGGEDGELFAACTWTNLRRQLVDAADKAEIAPISITSMRHSFAHRMKAEGIRQEDLAVAMGHRDTRMLDAIYARASTPAELVKRFDAAAAERQVALHVIQGGKSEKAAQSG